MCTQRDKDPGRDGILMWDVKADDDTSLSGFNFCWAAWGRGWEAMERADLAGGDYTVLFELHNVHVLVWAGVVIWFSPKDLPPPDRERGFVLLQWPTFPPSCSC